jgi:hypothetical protein
MMRVLSSLEDEFTDILWNRNLGHLADFKEERSRASVVPSTFPS